MAALYGPTPPGCDGSPLLPSGMSDAIKERTGLAAALRAHAAAGLGSPELEAAFRACTLPTGVRALTLAAEPLLTWWRPRQVPWVAAAQVALDRAREWSLEPDAGNSLRALEAARASWDAGEQEDGPRSGEGWGAVKVVGGPQADYTRYRAVLHLCRAASLIAWVCGPLEEPLHRPRGRQRRDLFASALPRTAAAPLFDLGQAFAGRAYLECAAEGDVSPRALALEREALRFAADRLV